VKGEKNEDQDIKNRMAMQAERPIRFLVFRKKKVARKNFYAEKQDK
jgi:hypothetical protein